MQQYKVHRYKLNSRTVSTVGFYPLHCKISSPILNMPDAIILLAKIDSAISFSDVNQKIESANISKIWSVQYLVPDKCCANHSRKLKKKKEEHQRSTFFQTVSINFGRAVGRRQILIFTMNVCNIGNLCLDPQYFSIHVWMPANFQPLIWSLLRFLHSQARFCEIS